MSAYTNGEAQKREKDVAEIRPVTPDGFQELIEDGTILPAEGPRQKFVPAGKRPGALARFLETRR